MKIKQDRDDHSNKISRRHFITLAAASLLAGCNPARQPAGEPTSTTTPAPTDTAMPTPTFTHVPAVERRRPEVVKFYPDAPSRVVHARHVGVWNGEKLAPEALRQMLDASITKLTGLNDAREAWQALFQPGERIVIKVNAFRNSLIWTHPPLVIAVTESLQEAGIPGEQIVVFDYYTSELKEAGYAVSQDRPGVRCYGTDGNYTGGWKVRSVSVELSNIVLDCDALINIPVLKSHALSGISFALKNHYGSISLPGSLHSNVGAVMAGLNALSPIKDRTRLVIGDALTACLRYKNSFPYWDSDWTGDSILMSFDPVAHDTVGLQMLSQLLTDDEGNSAGMMLRATPCLQHSAELGLGTNDLNHIEVAELNLS
jgi:hypothetical protein